MKSRFDLWFSQYRLLVLALVGSFIFHGSLLFAGSYRGTYDAYVHIFFADHYARSWWNPWEPRWYTGFTMFSYPPLTHQLTALISKFSSLPTGFILVMLTSSVITTLGVYRFSRLWVGHRPSLYAALLAVVSSSIAETVHVFGQLPTMFVIGIMLNALPFVWRWIDEADTKALARGWALLMMAAAGHHVTTLFGMVFFSGPIIATVLLRKFRTPRLDEISSDQPFGIRQLIPLIRRRVQRVLPAIIRCGVFGVGLVLILVITVLPYWLWSRSDPITQITIPHSSRDSFIENGPAGLMFFLIPWGMLLFVLPYAFYKGFNSPNWIMACSLAMMALLGTGGTTPIPAKLLGGSFYILTLDRFTFWSTIIILPLAGQFVESLLHGRSGAWLTAHLGWFWRILFFATFVAGLVIIALFTANLTQYRKFQPAPLNMTPIVEFLAKDNHDHWRFVTLGFGDQMAWLSAQTDALNVEGNYHSARRLPEMTSTPVERVDGAKFTGVPGLGSLQAFITNPQRYNLKYAFVNDAFYEPLLYFAGWHRLGALDNNVQVWERADVPPLPTEIPATIYPAWQRFMWGILPVGSLVVTSITFFLTGVIIPYFSLSLKRIPVVRWVISFRLIHFWLVDNDLHEPLPPSREWQLWRRFLKRFQIRLDPLPRRILYGSLLLIGIIAIVVVTLRTSYQKTKSPEAVILAYYDALDFKRFTESYLYLDTSLTREEYMRWLSLRGGILASFAKLNNLYIDLADMTGKEGTAHITAEWMTSLGVYTVKETWPLVKVAGEWRLGLDVVPPEQPRETFVTTSQVGLYVDLPLTSLDQTVLSRGVMDRSLLSVGSASVVYSPDLPIGFTPEPYDAKRIKGRFEGLISVIGVVKNESSVPAHITVTAVLRDAKGIRLAESNTRDVMIHQLWPQEITPFRVDFDGASASALLDITTVKSVDLIVRGVPTAYNLDRSLVLLKPGVLYNSGLKLVDIPHLLSTHVSKTGELLWVDSVYLEYAIAPDDTLAFTLPEMADNLEHLDIPVTITGPRLRSWTSKIPPLVIHGYSR